MLDAILNEILLCSIASDMSCLYPSLVLASNIITFTVCGYNIIIMSAKYYHPLTLMCLLAVVPCQCW